MKTFISALLLVGFSVFTVQAQQKSQQPVKQVVKRLIDVTPDGTKNITEIYASGSSNHTTTKVKPPKNNDVVHEEQNYDFNKKTFVTASKVLANGKIINNEKGAAKVNTTK